MNEHLAKALGCISSDTYCTFAVGMIQSSPYVDRAK